MNRRVLLGLRAVLGGVLLYAGLSKVSEGHALAESIANFRMLPAAANQLLAVTLPWWELSAGILLLLGLWERPAALVAAILFASFVLAVGLALLRGLDLECGCFGSGAAARVGVPTLILDAAGLFGAWGILRGGSNPLPADRLSAASGQAGPGGDRLGAQGGEGRGRGRRG